MIEMRGDLIKQHANGGWIVIPTNGMFNPKTRIAHAGAGLALYAAKRWRNWSAELGARLATWGNRCFAFPEYRIISFPSKEDWKDDSTLARITQSAHQLVELHGSLMPCLFAGAAGMLGIEKVDLTSSVFLPRVGCGLGKLEWGEVRETLERILDDRFIVVSPDFEE